MTRRSKRPSKVEPAVRAQGAVAAVLLAAIGGAVYLTALYLTGIVVAALIGVSLVHPKSEGLRDFGVALLVGVLILTVAMHIPLVGFILRIVVALVGLGLLTDRARSAWRASRLQSAAI